MNYITREQYDLHDCHLNPDSGCEVCEQWWEQQEHIKHVIAQQQEDIEGLI